MTAKIIDRISELCGEAPSVRLSAGGGTAYYPISDSLKAAFLDGGELREMRIKAKFKGEIPSGLFAAAEDFCRDIDRGDTDIEGEGFRVVRLEVTERPSMESCSENGMSIVSFLLSAEYILERYGYSEGADAK